MNQNIADPHPGLDVAVSGPTGPGGIAHRRMTHTERDPHYTDGRTMQKSIFPVVAACQGTDDRMRSVGWAHARHVGVELCPELACYPTVAVA